ncbi:MAG: transposase [Treponema sp.]
MTVPGIAPITALAYVGDINRFDNAHQVSNFIGFVPKVYNFKVKNFKISRSCS